MPRWATHELKTARSYRFTDKTLAEIELLVDRLGVNRTAVLERAIEELLLRTPAT